MSKKGQSDIADIADGLDGAAEGDAGMQQVLGHLDALDDAEAGDDAIAGALANAEAAESERQQDQQDRQKAAEFGAAMAVGFCEKMLTTRLPHVKVGDDDRARLVESLAPLLAKHGGGMPPWLVPYADELRFGMTVAGVGFGIWLQHQAHAAAVAQQATERARQDSRAQSAAAVAPVGTDVLSPVGTSTGSDPLDPSALE